MASLQHDAVPRCGKDLSTSSCLVFVHCKRSQVGLHVMGVTGRQMKSFRRASPQKVFWTRKSPDQGLAGARSSSSRSSLEGNLDAAMLTHAADSGKGRGCSMPVRRTRSGCCAGAPSGHAAAAPPSSVMNSRRLMCGWPPPGKRSLGVQHRGRLQSCVRPVDAARMDCWP
jgi:hypothetical protein